MFTPQTTTKMHMFIQSGFSSHIIWNFLYVSGVWPGFRFPRRPDSNGKASAKTPAVNEEFTKISSARPWENSQPPQRLPPSKKKIHVSWVPKTRWGAPHRPKMEHCFLSHCGVAFFAHDMMPKWSPRIPHPWCTPGRSFGSETQGIEWRKTLVKQFEGFTNFGAWDVLIVDILIFMLFPYIRIVIILLYVIIIISDINFCRLGPSKQYHCRSILHWLLKLKPICWQSRDGRKTTPLANGQMAQESKPSNPPVKTTSFSRCVWIQTCLYRYVWGGGRDNSSKKQTCSYTSNFIIPNWKKRPASPPFQIGPITKHTSKKSKGRR